MTRLPDQSKHNPNNLAALPVNNAADRKAVEEMVEVLMNCLDKDEVLAVGLAVELRGQRVYTDFTGGFNTMLVGALERLKMRILSAGD